MSLCMKLITASCTHPLHCAHLASLFSVHWPGVWWPWSCPLLPGPIVNFIRVSLVHGARARRPTFWITQMQAYILHTRAQIHMHTHRVSCPSLPLHLPLITRTSKQRTASALKSTLWVHSHQRLNVCDHSPIHSVHHTFLTSKHNSCSKSLGWSNLGILCQKRVPKVGATPCQKAVELPW